jgi:hypothetical protein
MSRETPSRETPKPSAPPKVVDAACDERWVEDFPNELACWSLSSEDPERNDARHRDELGLEVAPAAKKTVEHLHEDVGI